MGKICKKDHFAVKNHRICIRLHLYSANKFLPVSRKSQHALLLISAVDRMVHQRGHENAPPQVPRAQALLPAEPRRGPPGLQARLQAQDGLDQDEGGTGQAEGEEGAAVLHAVADGRPGRTDAPHPQAHIGAQATPAGARRVLQSAQRVSVRRARAEAVEQAEGRGVEAEAAFRAAEVRFVEEGAGVFQVSCCCFVVGVVSGCFLRVLNFFHRIFFGTNSAQFS